MASMKSYIVLASNLEIVTFVLLPIFLPLLAFLPLPTCFPLPNVIVDLIGVVRCNCHRN